MGIGQQRKTVAVSPADVNWHHLPDILSAFGPKWGSDATVAPGAMWERSSKGAPKLATQTQGPHTARRALG